MCLPGNVNPIKLRFHLAANVSLLSWSPELSPVHWKNTQHIDLLLFFIIIEFILIYDHHDFDLFSYLFNEMLR